MGQRGFVSLPSKLLSKVFKNAIGLAGQTSSPYPSLHSYNQHTESTNLQLIVNSIHLNGTQLQIEMRKFYRFQPGTVIANTFAL